MGKETRREPASHSVNISWRSSQGEILTLMDELERQGFASPEFPFQMDAFSRMGKDFGHDIPSKLRLTNGDPGRSNLRNQNGQLILRMPLAEFFTAIGEQLVPHIDAAHPRSQQAVQAFRTAAELSNGQQIQLALKRDAAHPAYLITDMRFVDPNTKVAYVYSTSDGIPNVPGILYAQNRERKRDNRRRRKNRLPYHVRMLGKAIRAGDAFSANRRVDIYKSALSAIKNKKNTPDIQKAAKKLSRRHFEHKDEWEKRTGPSVRRVTVGVNGELKKALFHDREDPFLYSLFANNGGVIKSVAEFVTGGKINEMALYHARTPLRLDMHGRSHHGLAELSNENDFRQSALRQDQISYMLGEYYRTNSMERINQSGRTHLTIRLAEVRVNGESVMVIDYVPTKESITDYSFTQVNGDLRIVWNGESKLEKTQMRDLLLSVLGKNPTPQKPNEATIQAKKEKQHQRRQPRVIFQQPPILNRSRTHYDQETKDGKITKPSFPSSGFVGIEILNLGRT